MSVTKEVTTKVCNVSVMVTCIAEDAEEVRKSLDDWFCDHNVALRRPKPVRVGKERKPTKREIEVLDIYELEDA